MGKLWFVVVTVCAFDFNTDLGYLVFGVLVLSWLHECKHKGLKH